MAPSLPRRLAYGFLNQVLSWRLYRHRIRQYRIAPIRECRVHTPTRRPQHLGAWARTWSALRRRLRRESADTRAGVRLEVKNLVRCPVIQPAPARARHWV